MACAAVLVLAACGDDGKTAAAPTTPPVKAQPPEQDPAPAATYTCKTHADCVASCLSPSECCEDHCFCGNVYHVDQLDALRKRCKGALGACDNDAVCGSPSQEMMALCSAGTCTGVLAPIGVRMENGYFVTGATPSPTECTADADCLANTVPDETGCCQNHMLKPHTVAYRDWVNAWRQEACKDVTCPPPPAPAQPADCELAVKCVDGACANSCGR